MVIDTSSLLPSDCSSGFGDRASVIGEKPARGIGELSGPEFASPKGRRCPTTSNPQAGNTTEKTGLVRLYLCYPLSCRPIAHPSNWIGCAGVRCSVFVGLGRWSCSRRLGFGKPPRSLRFRHSPATVLLLHRKIRPRGRGCTGGMSWTRRGRHLDSAAPAPERGEGERERERGKRGREEVALKPDAYHFRSDNNQTLHHASTRYPWRCIRQYVQPQFLHSGIPLFGPIQ